MRFDTSQQLRLAQQMKLSPRIIQAMEILQLPMLALQERIDAELQANPVLELTQPGVDEEEPLQREEEFQERGERDLRVDEGNGHSRDFQRLADFEDEFGPEFARSDAPSRPAANTGERDRKMDAMANAPSPEGSLDEYLLNQWRFVETDDATHAAGELIISFIEDDGYLRTQLEDIAKQAKPAVTAEYLQKALRLVQALDPIGVGARNLRECLLLQLLAEADAGRDVSLETELVSDYLREIELNRLPQIARRTGKELAEIKKAIENLSRLNPRPGSLVGKGSAPTISPDIVVDVDDNGNVVVTMADNNSPSLHISRAYRRMARDRQTDKTARQFVQNNIRSAQWLIEAILQRRQTVLRVAEEVFKVQRGFLEAGPEALKPLPMADVASRVGVHVATVSRAVAGKYVQTPRGIFPLRMFFSGGTTTAGGQDVSWDAVKAKLKELIDGEDKTNPLNDDQLVEELKKNGIDIARRTVAKYRGIMNIPPGRQRRRY